MALPKSDVTAVYRRLLAIPGFNDPFSSISHLLGAVLFATLGILASSTYLLNDLWDIADDRRHWSKRNRPLAAGRWLLPPNPQPAASSPQPAQRRETP